MAAPSINLEFSEGDRFRKKLIPIPGLGRAITVFLQSWPNFGERVCKDIRQMKFENGGRNYVVVFTRRAHRVGLMNVFETPRDERILREYLDEIRKSYCLGK